MKLIALAAALAMTGTAAIAQDTAQPAPAPPTDTSPAEAPTADTAPAETTPPPAPTAAPMPSTAAAGEDPAGGYMPSTPALSGTPAPGGQIIFQPSKSPAEAYPAPAPMQTYPICKKGQYDNCRQRGG